MLTIRFFRTGKKHQPFFKIVVTDKRKPPKSGRFVEEVGFYNPLTKEKNLKAERIKYWLLKGAQPSDTVHNLLVSEKIIESKKITLHKKAKKKEEKEPSSAKATEGEGKPAEVKPKEEKPAEVKSKEEKPVEKKPASAEATAGKEEPPKEEGVDPVRNP